MNTYKDTNKPNILLIQEDNLWSTYWKWTGSEFICGSLNGYYQPEPILGINNSKCCISMMMMIKDKEAGHHAIEFFKSRHNTLPI